MADLESGVGGAVLDTRHRRYPFLAVVLSGIMPGLGHIYCGRFVKGLVLAFLCVVLMLMLGVGLLAGGTAAFRPLIAISGFGVILLTLVAMIDSYYAARYTRADYKLKEYNRWYVYLLLVLISTGGSLGIAFEVRANYFEAFRIPTASMYPTLVPEDRFIADKTAYGLDRPERGDIVVFRNPDDRRITYIKRVIALAGDTVEVKDCEVYVNGEKLSREELDASMLDSIGIEFQGKAVQGRVFRETNDSADYLILLADPPHDAYTEDFAELEVPKGHCFVMGDNRRLSKDSRTFGPVPLADVKGRVGYLYFPSQDWSRFGRIDD